MKKINSVTGQRMTVSGFCLHTVVPEDYKSHKSVRVLWIPFQRPTVTETGLDGSENFTSHLKYVYSGGSLYPLDLLQ